MLSKRFDTTFTNSRMVWYEESAELIELISFKGHIQQLNAELSQSLGLTFTKGYSIWCPLETNVEQGDELVSGSNTYTVKAIKKFNIGVNKHTQLFVGKVESYG